MKKSLYLLFFIAPFSTWVFAVEEKSGLDNDGGLSLIQNSPFIPGFSGQNTTNVMPSNNFELKGIFKHNDLVRFSIYDKTTRKSIWVTSGEPNAAFEVKDYDPENQKVTIIAGGRLISLSLSTPSAQSSPMQQLQSAGYGSNYPISSSPVPTNYGQSSFRSSASNYGSSTGAYPSSSGAVEKSYPTGPYGATGGYSSGAYQSGTQQAPAGSFSNKMPAANLPSANNRPYSIPSQQLNDLFDDDFDDDED